MKKIVALTSLWLAAWTIPATGLAATLVVLEARSSTLTLGMRIDSNSVITLKDGERATFIGPDGKSLSLKGPFNGVPLAKASESVELRQALSALVATRDARTSSVGVVRAGTAAVKIPEPWLIDVTRPGPRCLLEGTQPVWWRPDASQIDSFTVFPVDRSWSAQFNWAAGQDRQPLPPLSRLEGSKVFVIRQGEQEYAISLEVVPKDLENQLILASWMLEKGCIQQADALLTLVRGYLKTGE
jgi:hypothetical protein